MAATPAAAARSLGKLRRMLQIPPHLLARELLTRSATMARNSVQRRRDLSVMTYGDTSPEHLAHTRIVAAEPSTDAAERTLALAELYLSHRFDLLGSGWVQVYHGRNCRGLEGCWYPPVPSPVFDRNGDWLSGRVSAANLPIARQIWSLVDADYRPIDWQLDFKSGYRWSESTWYRDVPIGHLLGVDVKVPWELSRMQHLPQLALAYALTRDERYAREVRNQVLDWIATNPPRFGVNWFYSMEVGIRLANWLMTYDLLRACGAQRDAAFERALSRSVYDHARHIVHNLEWCGALRANHYLANVVGLLFAASYLPRTGETDAWLAFGAHELLCEVERQFGEDGTHFEASTCYHRLSAEMVVWGTALLLGLPPEKQLALRNYEPARIPGKRRLKPGVLDSLALGHDAPLPPWYCKRLEKMAEFTMHITGPSSCIAQIGDNDSGRFFKLQPSVLRESVAAARARFGNLTGYVELPDSADYWVEDHLNHRHLVASIGVLFDRADLLTSSGPEGLDVALVRRFARGARLPSYLCGARPAAERVRVTGEAWAQRRVWLDALPEEQRSTTILSFPGGDLREDIQTFGYPNFGLYIFRSHRLFLCVRCGSVDRNLTAGHAHRDQLSIVLNIDGEDLIRDPGTALYTPLPIRRNEYRSSRAHAGPRRDPDYEADLGLGIFHLHNEGSAHCLRFDSDGFAGEVTSSRGSFYRAIGILPHALVIEDFAVGARLAAVVGRCAASLVHSAALAFSPGYGIWLKQDAPTAADA